MDIREGQFSGPTLLEHAGGAGATWNGQIEAITRLLVGFSPLLPEILKQTFGQTDDQVRAVVQQWAGMLNPSLFQDSMPLQDAIDLATYLVDVSVKFSQYSPGASVVGGPIEVAAISRFEGFRWVSAEALLLVRTKSPCTPRCARRSGMINSN